MDSSEDELRQRLTVKASSLFPLRWIDLDSARLLIAMRLIELCDAPDDISADFVDHAMRKAGLALVNALASEHLPARGIEHFSAGAPILHAPLPVLWWRRVVEFNNEYEPREITGEGGELPVHHLLWETSQLIRALPATPQKALAVITDIEVDEARLRDLGAAQYLPASENADAEQMNETRLKIENARRRGRKPDEEKRRAVRQIAKAVIKTKFVTLADFYRSVAEQYGETDPEGLNEKQVDRWIFGDE